MSIKEKHNLSDEQWNRVIGRVSDSTGIGEEKIAKKLSPGQEAFLYSAGAGIASAGIAYAVPAAIEAVREARIRGNRDKYIGQMKKVHPELRNMNKDDLNIAYNSIAASTPNVLKDPLLGGQTLKQFAQYRRADVTTLNEISRLQNNRPMDQAMINATNFLAQGVGKGVEAVKLEKDRLEESQYRRDLDKKKFELDTFKVRTLEQSKLDAQLDAAKYKKDRDVDLDKRYEQELKYKKSRDQQADTFNRRDYAMKEKQLKQQMDIHNMGREDRKYDSLYRRSRDTAQDAYRRKRDDAQDEYRRKRDTVLDKRYDVENAYNKDRDALRDAQWQIQNHEKLIGREQYDKDGDYIGVEGGVLNYLPAHHRLNPFGSDGIDAQQKRISDAIGRIDKKKK